MGRIHRMSEALANRIAAGEVVERPASVLKELVENSVDAGATQIAVTMRQGGLAELTVDDDGCGMDEADALACFERHATSKLRSDDDLIRLTTMGFRGEALASIASVARVVLRTASEGSAGHEVRLQPGQPPQTRSVARRQGTGITVSDLFFNTPARLQYMKTERAEAGAIVTWMTRLALAHPHLGLSLRDERRERLRVEPALDDASRQRRIEQLLGKGLAEATHRFEAERDGYRVVAFVARPELSRRDRRNLMIFVGGRYVEDRRLQQAVVEGFRSVLEVGRNPVAAVFVDAPAGMVDVNVHPQKIEVRLAQPRLVFSLVRGAIADGLAEAPWLKKLPVADSPATEDAAVRRPASSVFRAPGSIGNSPSRSGSFGARPAPGYGALGRSMSLPVAESAGGGRAGLEQLRRAMAAPTAAPATDAPRQASAPSPSLLRSSAYADLRPIGQVARTYLLLEGTEGLVVIDQHAAHERIVFGRLQRALTGETMPRQGLLLPIRLELDGEEEAALIEHRDLVERFGFTLNQSGDHIEIHAVPALLSAANPQRMLADLAGALVAGDGEDELARAQDAVIARLACHGSLRAGQALQLGEIAALMRELDEAEHRSHCPHGRPFVVQLSAESLGQWFHRD